MPRALLGLGSNVGDRRHSLADAVATLRALGLVAVSSVYETEPMGGPPQPHYLNVVVQLETDATARELLGVCHRLESAAGRVRTVRWGPRPLDVDILWIDGVEIDEPDLQVPHPRMRTRRFVMAPLADLAPDVAGEGWDDDAEGQVTMVGFV